MIGDTKHTRLQLSDREHCRKDVSGEMWTILVVVLVLGAGVVDAYGEDKAIADDMYTLGRSMLR